MRYAIVSTPRDSLAGGLRDAGSVAIVSRNIALRLARRHDVRIVAPRGTGQSDAEALAERVTCRRVSIPHYRYHKYREMAASLFESLPPHFLSAGYFHGYYANAAEALRDFNPEVIHIQNFGQSARLFRERFPAARIVIHAHDTCPARAGATVGNLVLGAADVVVTCSDYVAKTIQAALPQLRTPVRSISNGVDVDEFAPRNVEKQTDAAVRLLYVGRLSPEKGTHVLMEGFNRAIGVEPRLRLDVVGPAAIFAYEVVKIFVSDPNWAALRSWYGTTPLTRLSRQLGGLGRRYKATLHSTLSLPAAAATRFRGTLAHAELAREIASYDILVVPSVCDEPFGIPAIEAMAAGLPVIASRAGGIADIVEEGVTGVLVPRARPEALAQAIVELARDPERCASMGAAGRERVLRRFTWDATVRRLESALQEIGVSL